MLKWNEFRTLHSGRGLSAKELSELWSLYKQGQYTPDAIPPKSDEEIEAAVEAAVPQVMEVEPEEAPWPQEIPTLGEWLNNWVWNERSHLSIWVPQLRILQAPVVNLVILFTSSFLLIALIWNMFTGLANGCVSDASVGCTIDWSTMIIDNLVLQQKVADSAPAPNDPDWLGSLLMFAAASVVWATMPCDD